jgi:hypothetical protein
MYSKSTLYLELSTRGDDDLGTGLSTSRTNGFNVPNYVHTFNDGSEDDVLSIQPGSLGRTDEELLFN